ncbi:MAG: efflux RND transporter periplasmic adaptor subunit [Pseudomonadales bacterium]|jgi:Cu(I)/Ag(I) efflux system membrane fusion protein
MKLARSVLLVLTGLAAGVLLMLLLPRHEHVTTGTDIGRKPLYWVAPMDPDYRRDAPGKSPMGMDLIPVYAEDDGDDAGVVRISPAVENNMGVRTATVARGVFAPVIRTVGHVTFDEDQLVHIHPRVEGWIESLGVKAEGDPVTEGEPLFALYSPTLVNAQEELVLALNRDNPGLIRAALERLAALEVPQSAIDELRRSRRVTRTITPFAPRSGVLRTLAVREGMYVSPGMNVMTIGPLDHVWVVGELYERQASLVSTGDAVQLTLDYLPGRVWSGRVDYVYPSLNEETRTVRIRSQIDNADRSLKPGMYGELGIHPAVDARPALLIPREALIRTGEQNRVVLALDGGRFKSVAVTPGRIGNDRVEIIAGLEEGDRIVTSAQFLIDSESSKSSDFQRMEMH